MGSPWTQDIVVGSTRPRIRLNAILSNFEIQRISLSCILVHVPVFGNMQWSFGMMDPASIRGSLWTPSVVDGARSGTFGDLHK
jgi:hypothetical protein